MVPEDGALELGESASGKKGIWFEHAIDGDGPESHNPSIDVGNPHLDCVSLETCSVALYGPTYDSGSRCAVQTSDSWAVVALECLSGSASLSEDWFAIPIPTEGVGDDGPPRTHKT